MSEEFQFSNNIATFPTLGPFGIGYSKAMERTALSDVGERFDIVHQTSIWSAKSRVTNRWRSRFQRPTVVAPQGALEAYTLRRSAWKKRLASIMYEAVNLRNATCLQATSPTEVISFREYGLVNPVAVIPNGISDSWVNSHGDGAEFRGQFSLSESKRIGLFLSRIHPKKGLPILFKALAEIRKWLEDWIFVVAGPGELTYRRELQRLAQELEIIDKIRFIDPVYGQDKRNAFAAADLFVLPTHSDNFAIAVAEALGAAVPVLTTYGAPWEDLQTHECGWWVPIDADAVKKALLEAIQLPRDALRAMGQRGKVLVAQRFTWSRIAEMTIELYDWLLYSSERPDFVLLP